MVGNYQTSIFKWLFGVPGMIVFVFVDQLAGNKNLPSVPWIRGGFSYMLGGDRRISSINSIGKVSQTRCIC